MNWSIVRYCKAVPGGHQRGVAAGELAGAAAPGRRVPQRDARAGQEAAGFQGVVKHLLDVSEGAQGVLLHLLDVSGAREVRCVECAWSVEWSVHDVMRGLEVSRVNEVV